MSDHDTERWVSEELHWDPKLDSKAIAVSVADGEVTLRGTVGSFHEKRDAERAALRVIGVKTVSDHLEVRPLTQHRRKDADLRGAVLRALKLNSPAASLGSATRSGWRTRPATPTWRG